MRPATASPGSHFGVHLLQEASQPVPHQAVRRPVGDGQHLGRPLQVPGSQLVFVLVQRDLAQLQVEHAQQRVEGPVVEPAGAAAGEDMARGGLLEDDLYPS